MERPTFARSNNDVVEFVLSRVQSPHQRGLNQPPRQEDAGLTARQAADQLGHAKVSMTQDNYFGRKVARTGAPGFWRCSATGTTTLGVSRGRSRPPSGGA
jgi:hypothetical protein